MKIFNLETDRRISAWCNVNVWNSNFQLEKTSKWHSILYRKQINFQSTMNSKGKSSSKWAWKFTTYYFWTVKYFFVLTFNKDWSKKWNFVDRSWAQWWVERRFYIMTFSGSLEGIFPRMLLISFSKVIRDLKGGNIDLHKFSTSEIDTWFLRHVRRALLDQTGTYC